jgi:SAM-dependent methyltransferase
MSSRPFTIIEAGFNTYPSFGAPGRQALEKDQLYIGLGRFVDPRNPGVDPGQLARGTKFCLDVRNGLDFGTRHVVRGDVTNMPFGNNFADAIIVPNVIGDPAFPNIRNALGEVARVLRPLGRLTVVETLDRDTLPVDHVARMLRTFGFHRDMDSGDEHNPALIAQYADRQAATSYAASFTLDP